ncbi:unnamed protein product [Nesidiocoris tenuis]|uniref:Uncharacterized protein n=1 Tax=Nesidiocoris tenuis TaxID=355587 RepID=A0A6H5GD02_9HEMI|nr:unnamed protein product [Nesidiocoris tenuis]
MLPKLKWKKKFRIFLKFLDFDISISKIRANRNRRIDRAGLAEIAFRVRSDTHDVAIRREDGPRSDNQRPISGPAIRSDRDRIRDGFPARNAILLIGANRCIRRWYNLYT